PSAEVDAAGKGGRRGDLDQRRAHNAITDAVAATELRDDRVFRMLCRFLMSNGFVDLGVEALADRVDWLQAVGSQGLLELADAELQPLDPGLINAFGLVFEHVPQV